MNKWIKLIIAILICQAAGIIGSLFTFQSIPTWYATLNKPSFSPPNWLFGPAWITLYTLMGISLYLVWEKGFSRKALYAFSIQLVLNALWSVIFFGFKLLSYAFAEIIVLWISIAFTIFAFYKISKKAAYILIPYIAWVSIASILNYYVWILNL